MHSIPTLSVKQPMERRRSPRNPCRIPIKVAFSDSLSALEEDDCCEMLSVNVSESGILLSTELFFQLGEPMVLEISAPGRSQPIRCQSSVARVSATHLLESAMALAFHNLDEDSRGALARFSPRTTRSTS